MPLPNTRSSSPMPVVWLVAFVAEMVVIFWAGEVGVSPLVTTPVVAAWVALPAAAGWCSCMDPQVPHSGQRPNHLGLE